MGVCWESIIRSIVELAHRDAQDLSVTVVCLPAADQRHSKANKVLEELLTHQLLAVPHLHKTGKLQGVLLVTSFTCTHYHISDVLRFGWRNCEYRDTSSV